MKKIRFRKIASTIVLLAISVGAIFICKHNFIKPEISRVEKNIQNRSRGNPSAKLWVVEYIDFQCIDCAKASQWLDGFYQKNSKRMYQQVRFNPLMKNHAHALKSAIYAECVSRHGKFWAYQELLFKTQAQWADLPEPDVFFEKLAEEAGMPRDKIRKCVDQPEIKAAVMEEKDGALSLSIKGTPTFFVNGEMIFGFEAVKKALENIVFEDENT